MNNLFPAFEAWQAGYGAFTCSMMEKPKLIDYIKNQEVHHKKKTSKEELIELLFDHGIKFDLKYLQ